jgi:molybdopterin synthase sulfur carrier subunit
MTGGKSEVEIEGQTVGQLIENLGATHPGLKERLYDEKGEVRRFINIYVNEEDIRFLTGTDTPLKDGDEVSIIPAIAGGA